MVVLWVVVVVVDVVVVAIAVAIVVLVVLVIVVFSWAVERACNFTRITLALAPCGRR